MAKVILRVGKAAAGVIAALVVIGFILVTLRSGPPVQAENVLPTDPAVSAAFVQARDYTNNKQYVQAEVVYIDLLSQYPGTDCAFAARNELAYLYVAWEKWSEADTEIGQLAGDFSNNSDLPYALWAIGSRLEKKKQFQRAQSVYQQIVTDYAGTDMAWQAQPRLDFLNVRVNIISVIESGDYAGADTAVNTLISDFAGEQRLAGLLNTIAKSYEIQGEFARAESIFQQVAQGYTNKDGLKAQANLAKLYITGQVAGDADAATDSLARDFSGSRHFAKTLRQVGRKFAETGQYEKSRDIYEQVTTAEPNSLGALQARTDLIRMSISGRGGVRVREAIDELAEGFAGRRQLTGALDNIARTYEKIGRHKEAEGVYQRMAEAQSDNQSASVAQINALKANVLSAIASGDFVTAQEGAERLVADFGVFTELSPTLGSIGQAYIDKAEYDSAYVIFEYIASAWPGSDVELQAQKGVALACLALADETNADVAINKIYSAFSNHKDTAEVIFKLANKCCDIARYDRALNLYQDILTYWPQSRAAAWVPAAMEASQIAQGNNPGISQVDIFAMVSNHSGSDYLSKAAPRIGWEYYHHGLTLKEQGDQIASQQYFSEAADSLELLVNSLPPGKRYGTMCYLAGNCFSEAGRYAKAIACYQKLVNECPDYQYTWHILFLIGEQYKEMAKSGLIGEDEAGRNIKLIYQRLVRDYPNSSAARLARQWLSQHSN